MLTCLPVAASDYRQMETQYDPGPGQPFGKMNPQASPEVSEFSFLIGRNDCHEERRDPQTGQWQTPGKRIWDAAWYMNGHAVRDWGSTSGGQTANIRIFDPVDGRWKVSYFSSPTYSNGIWQGGLQGADIVLTRPQKAPNGTDGESRLTFYEIADTSFRWKGEWVAEDGSVIYPFWRITCQKLP